MPTLSFAVTYDYRCPFARNIHEHLAAALRGGADWDVEFLPFSLRQTKVAEDEASVWDEPDKDSGLLALQASVAVRDDQPDRFLDAHVALFSLRHDEGGDLREEDQVRKTLEDVGVDADAVFATIGSGKPLQIIHEEHERAVNAYSVFGVPTFIAGDDAVFVRVMNRDEGDAKASTEVIERLVRTLVGWPELNEFKHTSISR
jgi:protein-disulfide isomerase-like protein with CxxC motif